jgi:hypothetical protein
MKYNDLLRLQYCVLAITFFSTAIIAGETKSHSVLTSIESRIEKEGAQIILRKVYGKSEWKSIIEGIQMANPRWLRIGKDLRKVSDAGASEELRISLAQGLEVNPANVFRNALNESDSAQVSWVCQTTGIERPMEVEIRSVEKRILAIQSIKENDLEKISSICLGSLETIKTRLFELDKSDSKLPNEK